MSQLVKELQGTDFWKLRRAYSPGSMLKQLLSAVSDIRCHDMKTKMEIMLQSIMKIENENLGAMVKLSPCDLKVTSLPDAIIKIRNTTTLY
ncbi:hypothetical protein HN873_048305 [Arachis hypogaea]